MLRKYLEFARIGFRESLAYRVDAFMSFATTLFYLLLAYYIWGAIAATGSLESSFGAVITYIFLGQVVWNSVSVNLENEIGDRVRKGTIVNELKRPVSLRGQLYFYALGRSAFSTITRGIPVVVIGFLVAGLQFPSAVNAAAFLLSLFLGFNLVFALSYFTSMFVFWTKVGWSIRSMRTTVQSLLSGVLFPLYLLPDYLKPVFNATPFPSMVDTPIQIFRMETTGPALLGAFGKQIFWIVVLLLLGQLVWIKAREKLTVQGG
ncbi:MAG: ABC transporter permease [Candidatus Nanohaloarchaea archaeon]